MIHELNSSLLKNVMPKFDFTNPPIDPIELAHDLAQSMLDKNGMGVAANQLGLPYRAFAIKSNPIIVCFNPIIVDQSNTKLSVLEESCISFPGLYLKVKRPHKIKVRYTEPNGNVVTTFFEGLTSRIFQHELDHLNGTCYTERANRIHLEQARKKQKNLFK